MKPSHCLQQSEEACLKMMSTGIIVLCPVDLDVQQIFCFSNKEGLIWHGWSAGHTTFECECAWHLPALCWFAWFTIIHIPPYL